MKQRDVIVEKRSGFCYVGVRFATTDRVVIVVGTEIH